MATATRPTIAFGSRGTAVTEAQQLLNRYGAGLAVDGQFGTLTKTAVMNFQRAQGIAVDGIIGPVTWSRLLSSQTVTPAIPPTPAVPNEPAPVWIEEKKDNSMIWIIAVIAVIVLMLGKKGR